MKKRISVAILFVVVIYLFTACATHTDTKGGESFKYISEFNAIYPERSLEEIVSDSELVVRAKKTGEKTPVMRDRIGVTDNLFEILEIFKGDKKIGDEIAVEMIGGIVGDTKYVSSAYSEVNENEEVLLVLHFPTDANDEISSKDYYVFYPPSGIFYKNQDVTATENDNEFTSFDKRYTYQPSAFQKEVNRILKQKM